MKKNLSGVLLVGLVMAVMVNPAYARDRHHDGPDRHHRAHWPRAVHALPRAHTTIVVTGLPYYYYEGIFYRQASSGYVYVNAPLGAVVPVVPPMCHTVIVNGMTYYTYDNVYYQPQPTGYMVVPPPVVKPAPVVVPAQAPAPVVATTTSKDAYVVNVPNPNGSYVPVIIKKEGNAFVGPQGEYYAIEPTIEQLKVMYAIQ